jgi:transposase
MYVGIDLHKEHAQVAVMDDTGEIVEETRVRNASLEDLAQRYAGGTAAIEATSNYYHIQKTLSEHLDVTAANPNDLGPITQSDKKTDRVDAKKLARLARLDALPESYVPSEEIWECRALVRGRQSLKQTRTEYANRVKSILNQHGVTRNVEPLSESGRDSLRQLDLPLIWTELVEASLNTIEALTEQINRLEEVIQERAASREETQLLMSIPGVSYLSALTVVAEIGEIDRFDSHKRDQGTFAGFWFSPRMSQFTPAKTSTSHSFTIAWSHEKHLRRRLLPPRGNSWYQCTICWIERRCMTLRG